MVPLTSLNPEWNGIYRKGSGELLEFDCPWCKACFQGPHRLSVAIENPLDGGPTAAHLPVLWLREGEAFESLTIKSGTARRGSSIDYSGRCGFHGFIEGGSVLQMNECPFAVVLPGDTSKQIVLSPRQAREFCAAFLEAGKVVPVV